MTIQEAKVVDSTHIELSKPIQVSEGSKIMVSVTGVPESDEKRKEWGDASRRSLQRAYGESEPDYSAKMIKEANPDYRS